MGDMPSQGSTLAIIGCGNMAGAVLSALVGRIGTADCPIKNVLACVRSQPSRDKLNKQYDNHKDKVAIFVGDNLKAASAAEIILLGHKPFQVNQVLGQKGMADALRGKLIVSLLAGVSAQQIQEALFKGTKGDSIHVIRACPNMGALVQQSMTIIAEPEPATPSEMVDLAKWMFESIGKVQIVPDNLYGLGVVIVGAYIALTTIAVEGMLHGAVIEGLKKPQAQEIVSQCLLATGMLLADGTHPAVLRDSISSPRGCTVQAIRELDKGNARSTFTEAILKATEHVKTMGKEQDK